MKKYVGLYLVFFMWISAATAQDKLTGARQNWSKRDTKVIDVLSIDKKTSKLTIAPDYEGHTLRIVYLKDTISIADFWGVPPIVHMLNKNFIEIRYALRGGTNLELENVMVVCVKGKHLYEAMHALKFCKWDTGTEKNIYSITFTLSGNDINTYKLNVNVTDGARYKNDTAEDYNYTNYTTLSFDKNRNVFLSIKKFLDNPKIIEGNSPVGEQKIAANIPVIILGKATYFFVNHKWYQSNVDPELTGI